MKIHNSPILKSLLLTGVFLGFGNNGLAADAGASPTNQAAAESKISHGTGVVKAIDKDAGTVTLAHEPIPELNWPAMTMPFKVAGDAAAKVSVGEKVTFELSGDGNAATITKMEKAD